MLDSVLKTVVGDLGDKRAYRQMMKRANALPEEYRYAFNKMRDYLYTVGYSVSGAQENIDLALFDDLIDLLAAGAAEHKSVPEMAEDREATPAVGAQQNNGDKVDGAAAPEGSTGEDLDFLQRGLKKLNDWWG